MVTKSCCCCNWSFCTTGAHICNKFWTILKHWEFLVCFEWTFWYNPMDWTMTMLAVIDRWWLWNGEFYRMFLKSRIILLWACTWSLLRGCVKGRFDYIWKLLLESSKASQALLLQRSVTKVKLWSPLKWMEQSLAKLKRINYNK